MRRINSDIDVLKTGTRTTGYPRTNFEMTLPDPRDGKISDLEAQLNASKLEQKVLKADLIELLDLNSKLSTAFEANLRKIEALEQQIKDFNDAKSSDKGSSEAKLEKLEAELRELEVKNNQLTTALEEKQRQIQDLKSRNSQLEFQIKNLNQKNQNYIKLLLKLANESIAQARNSEAAESTESPATDTDELNLDNILQYLGTLLPIETPPLLKKTDPEDTEVASDTAVEGTSDDRTEKYTSFFSQRKKEDQACQDIINLCYALTELDTVEPIKPDRASIASASKQAQARLKTSLTEQENFLKALLTKFSSVDDEQIRKLEAKDKEITEQKTKLEELEKRQTELEGEKTANADQIKANEKEIGDLKEKLDEVKNQVEDSNQTLMSLLKGAARKLKNSSPYYIDIWSKSTPFFDDTDPVYENSLEEVKAKFTREIGKLFNFKIELQECLSPTMEGGFNKLLDLSKNYLEFIIILSAIEPTNKYYSELLREAEELWSKAKEKVLGEVEKLNHEKQSLLKGISDLGDQVSELEAKAFSANIIKKKAEEERDEAKAEKEAKIARANERLLNNKVISDLEGRLDDYTYRMNYESGDGVQSIWTQSFASKDSELPKIAEERLRGVLMELRLPVGGVGIGDHQELIALISTTQIHTKERQLSHDDKIKLYQATIDYLVLQGWTTQDQELALKLAGLMVSATQYQIKLAENANAAQLSRDLETYKTQLNQLKQKESSSEERSEPELSGQVMVGVAERVLGYVDERIAHWEKTPQDSNGENLLRYQDVVRNFKHIDNSPADGNSKFTRLLCIVENENGFVSQEALSPEKLKDFYLAELQLDIALRYLYTGKQYNTKLHDQEFHLYNRLFVIGSDVGVESLKTKLLESVNSFIPPSKTVVVEDPAIEVCSESSPYPNVLSTIDRIAAALAANKRSDVWNGLTNLYLDLINFEIKKIAELEETTEPNLDGVSLEELKENLAKHKKAFDEAVKNEVELEFELEFEAEAEAEVGKESIINKKIEELKNKFNQLNANTDPLYVYNEPYPQNERAHNENLPLKSRLKAIGHHLNILEAQIAVLDAGGQLKDGDDNEIKDVDGNPFTSESLGKMLVEARAYRDKLKGLYKEEKRTKQEVFDLDDDLDNSIEDSSIIKKSKKAAEDAAKKSPGKDLPLKSSTQLREKELKAYSWADYQVILAEMLKLGETKKGDEDEAFKPVITTVQMNDLEAFDSEGKVKFRDEMKRPIYRMAYYDRSAGVVRDVVVPQEDVEKLMEKSGKKAHLVAHRQLSELAHKIEDERKKDGKDSIPEGFRIGKDKDGNDIKYTKSGPSIEIKNPATIGSKQEVKVSFAKIDRVDFTKDSITTHYQDLKFGNDPIKTNLYTYKLETTIAAKDGTIDGVVFSAGDPLVRIVRVGNGKIQPVTDYQGNLLTGVQLGASEGVYTDIYNKLRNPDQIVTVSSKRFDVDQNKTSETKAVFKGLGRVEYIGRNRPHLVGREGAKIKSRINYFGGQLNTHFGREKDSLNYDNNLTPTFRFEVVQGHPNVITISNVTSDADLAQVFADLSARLSNPDIRNGQSKWPWVPNDKDPNFHKPLKIVFEGCEITNLDQLKELSRRNFKVSAVECKGCHKLRDVSGLNSCKGDLENLKITGSPNADLRQLSGLRDKNTTRKLYVTVDRQALTGLQEYGAKYPRDSHYFSKQIKFGVEKSGFVKEWTSIEPKNVEAIIQQVSCEPESLVLTYLSNEDVVRVRNQAVRCGHKVTFGNQQYLGNAKGKIQKARDGDYVRSTRITGNVLRTVLDLSLGNLNYFLDYEGKKDPQLKKNNCRLFKYITEDALKLERIANESDEQFSQRKKDVIELIRKDIEKLRHDLRDSISNEDKGLKLLLAEFQQKVVEHFGFSLDSSLSFRIEPEKNALKAFSLTQEMLNSTNENLLKLSPKGSKAELDLGTDGVNVLSGVFDGERCAWDQSLIDPADVKQKLITNRQEVSNALLKGKLEELNHTLDRPDVKVALDLSSFSHITRLGIVDNVAVSANQIASSMPNLSATVTSLNLAGCKDLYFTGALKADLMSLRNLTHLDLTGIDLDKDRQNMLQELYNDHPNKGNLKIIIGRNKENLGMEILEKKPSPILSPQYSASLASNSQSMAIVV